MQVTLVDGDADVVAALRACFADRPAVEVVGGSILERDVDAWALPARPGGALDAAAAEALGAETTAALRRAFSAHPGGALPLGDAVCVPSERRWPRFVIATPAPSASGEVPAPLRVALAVGAALQAVHAQNATRPRSIETVALPSFGAGTGLSAEACAELTWTAYELFRAAHLPDAATLRAALERLLSGAEAGGPGAYKRSYEQASRTAKETLPDNAAAQAQLRMRIDRARRSSSGESTDGDE